MLVLFGVHRGGLRHQFADLGSKLVLHPAIAVALQVAERRRKHRPPRRVSIIEITTACVGSFVTTAKDPFPATCRFLRGVLDPSAESLMGTNFRIWGLLSTPCNRNAIACITVATFCSPKAARNLSPPTGKTYSKAI